MSGFSTLYYLPRSRWLAVGNESSDMAVSKSQPEGLGQA